MSEVTARTIPAVGWTAAAPAMTIPPGAKGVLVLGGGTITMTGQNAVSVTLAPSGPTVFPMVPTSVTAATNAFVLW